MIKIQKEGRVDGSLVKYSPCKNENLGSDSQTLHRVLDAVAPAVASHEGDIGSRGGRVLWELIGQPVLCA